MIAVRSLLDSPARIVAATDAVLSEAYDVSVEKNHDVYDSFLIAMARAHEADYLVTTDEDFYRLCDEGVRYRIPIPEGERGRLSLGDDRSFARAVFRKRKTEFARTEGMLAVECVGTPNGTLRI